MGVVRYTVVEGEIIAEKRSGVRRQYVPDPLGSTVALLDSTQAKTDTFSYWPYGEEAICTGTTLTPFTYVGTAGYYRDSGGQSYIRARYLSNNLGRWLTEDPTGFASGDWNLLWYVGDSPNTNLDSLRFRSRRTLPTQDSVTSNPTEAVQCGIDVTKSTDVVQRIFRPIIFAPPFNFIPQFNFPPRPKPAPPKPTPLPRMQKSPFERFEEDLEDLRRSFKRFMQRINPRPAPTPRKCTYDRLGTEESKFGHCLYKCPHRDGSDSLQRYPLTHKWPNCPEEVDESQVTPG